METRRVRLGALVYCVAYRNPGLHAKSLTTIDHLSGGRVDCDIGAGWHDVEATAFGFEFPRTGVREDMLEEYAQCLRLLFDPEGAARTSRANTSGSRARRTSPSPCSRACPSGSADGARSARCARRPNTRTAGTRPTSARTSGFTRAGCWTSGARPRSATRGRFGAPSTRASPWGPTPRASLAGKRSSATTGARGATSARAGCAAPRRTRGELVAKFRDAGCARVNIAFRDGPYDWDARRAFAEDVVATS